MNCDEYRAIVRQIGLTPMRPSSQGSTVHQSRDGILIQVEDPEHLTPEKRAAVLDMLKFRLGITFN